MKTVNNNFVIIIYIVTLFTVTLAPSSLLAQRIGVSTDALKIATLSPNVALDFNVTQTSTLSIELSLNPFTMPSGNKLKHTSFAPGYKYWFNQVMSGHYIGAEVRFTTYDIALRDKSWRGDIWSAGVNYGYSFLINKSINIVPHIGVGYGVKCDYDSCNWERSGIIPQFGVNVQYVIFNWR